jgi:hypothetical protein
MPARTVSSAGPGTMSASMGRLTGSRFRFRAPQLAASGVSAGLREQPSAGFEGSELGTDPASPPLPSVQGPGNTELRALIPHPPGASASQIGISEAAGSVKRVLLEEELDWPLGVSRGDVIAGPVRGRAKVSPSAWPQVVEGGQGRPAGRPQGKP